MEHLPIAILLVVSVVALGAITTINMAVITGNFQFQEHAPIESIAALFSSPRCQERIIYQDFSRTIIDPDPNWCNK
ncbi:MAG TPA: hypothetical protein VJJ82_05670 [Candidatus Nanoarchaeia archaeon]|nr:hypothetical protein [Candidatus Nanoarchaeia archaeon]